MGLARSVRYPASIGEPKANLAIGTLRRHHTGLGTLASMLISTLLILRTRRDG